MLWPRSYNDHRRHVELYQPQIETWEGNRISGRAAVAVSASEGALTYGVAHFSAIVDIDRSSGIAQLSHIEIASVEVPTNPAIADKTRQVLLAHLPPAGLITSLDELQTSYAASKQLAAMQGMAVKNDAPRIVFATRPTVLVLVDGPPVWRPVNGTSYQRALNGRALLLQENGSGTLYLHAAGYWYSAASANGQWGVRTAPQQALLAAAQRAEASAKADPLLPANGQRPARVPVVLFATEPTELIVTDGQMKLVPVQGVSLLSVSNTDHAVFVDPATNQYYVLVSGRWFRAASEGGPWRYVPGGELPADFAKISPHDPNANVLVSVPGTPQAKEAAIATSIAQTATVSRATATLVVAYDGAVRFTPIAGTALNYAINTATPVIEVDPVHYYAESNGIWFTADAPDGAWRVATEVPNAIYAIPASSPLHYVVYVRIYSVTPRYRGRGLYAGLHGRRRQRRRHRGLRHGLRLSAVRRLGLLRLPAHLWLRRRLRTQRGNGVRLRFRGGCDLGLGRALLGTLLGRRRMEQRQRESGEFLWPLGARHGHPCVRLESVDGSRRARLGGVRLQPGHRCTLPG